MLTLLCAANLRPHLGPMLQLKLIEIGPSITQIGLNLDCSLEPLSSLGGLPLGPE